MVIIMPQSLSKIYLHIVFSTKHRTSMIDKTIEPHLHQYLGGICKGLDSQPVQIGGYTNHVHILCQMSRKISPSDLVQELKQSSSKWMKTKNNKYSQFYWQNGYGVFSLSQSHVGVTVDYIKNQHIHHQSVTFKEEFRRLLEKHEIEYDERYVWD